MFVHVLFPEQTMSADGQAVIRGEDHDRLVSFTSALQCFENPTNLSIEVRDQGVLLPAVHADRRGCAGKRGQHLVTQALRIGRAQSQGGVIRIERDKIAG